MRPRADSYAGGMVPIGGSCDPRFAAVRTAVADNFSQRGELGAAACATVDGRSVVDLWGGWADAARTHPWERDTLVNAYSVGKPIVALSLLQQVDRGRIALDSPASRWWADRHQRFTDALA